MRHDLLMHNQLGTNNTPAFLNPVMRPVAYDDEIRQKLERFISSTYKSVFNATLKCFLPNLVAATLSNGEIRSAFGYCDASQDRLFLESYLDGPIESLLSQKAGQCVPRNKIVEVGNLSIDKNANSVSTIRDIACYLQKLGYEWIVCTATRYLRVLFLKSGSRPISIARASISRVSADGTDWGNYYLTVPEILGGNIEKSILMIEQNIASSRNLPGQNFNLFCLKSTPE